MRSRPPRDRHRDTQKAFARHDMHTPSQQSVARCSKLGLQIDSENSCGKADDVDLSGQALERYGFCLRGFWFMLSWPEVNQTSRTSSASLRKNCASFRFGGKKRAYFLSRRQS